MMEGRGPDGMDADKKGESYAAKVAVTLQGRCELLRWTPPARDEDAT